MILQLRERLPSAINALRGAGTGRGLHEFRPSALTQLGERGASLLLMAKSRYENPENRPHYLKSSDQAVAEVTNLLAPGGARRLRSRVVRVQATICLPRRRCRALAFLAPGRALSECTVRPGVDGTARGVCRVIGGRCISGFVFCACSQDVDAGELLSLVAAGVSRRLRSPGPGLRAVRWPVIPPAPEGD